MALSYDQRKKSYESFDDNQKQQYDNLLKNKGDDYIGNQYMKQYQQDLQPQTPGKAQDTRQQAYTQKQPENLDMTMDEYKKQNPRAMTLDEWNNSEQKKQYDAQNNQVSPELDQSKFGASTGQIRVQEGTAKDTGMPDYQAESEARNREITDNLNYYWENNRDYFSSREKFNNIFHYNDRNDSQRAILDSYWKRKEDMDYVSQFNSGESIYRGMNNGQITTDQLNILKETDQKAYIAWQEKQEEEIKKRIINDIVPPLMDDIATQMTTMMNRLGIDPQNALDIEGAWHGMMEQTGAYQTMMDANNTVKQIEAINNKKNSIMNRYAASTGGTVSDALAAARMQKAIAPYNEALQGLQYQYQDYANLYNQKLATANQAAQVRQMQAQENERVWQQRLTALGFAADAMSYRTPEQQAQLKIQTQQALDAESLLYQSRLNDLTRYNTYATAKLENQLQQELTDLSVEDEQQLKANLNNALSDYYKNYGDIIQRSQAQAVEDIIAYAKKNGISVAQALTENFVKPLQNKAEYKQKVASDYGMLVSQSIATINGRSVIMTTNPNGTISYKYIDSGITDSYTIDGVDYVVYNGQQMTAKEFNEKYGNKVGTVKPYDMVDNKVFDTSPVSHSYYTLADFLIDPNNQAGKKGGQCAKFVNDYLEKIGVGRYFGTEDIKTRENWCNSDTAKVGTIAVFDYNHYTDGKNYGHVGIVVDTDENGFWVLDSNYDTKNPGTIQKRYVRYGSSSCKGFFDPSQPPRTTNNDSKSSVDTLTLTALRNGQIVNSKVPETIQQLVKAGFSEDEINEALNQNMEYYLPDDQRAEKNAILNAFRQNSIVQNFQSSTEQLLGLSAAVDQANGAGDLASIYMFMRAQDPKSVVREGEFEMAAQTMGLGGQVETWFSKLANGQRLTADQRQNFIDVTVKVLEARKQAYKMVYDETIQQMKAASIPSVYYPTDWATEIDGIISKLKGGNNTSGPDDYIYEIYSSAMDNGSSIGLGYNNATYSGYQTDFLHSMINEKL